MNADGPASRNTSDERDEVRLGGRGGSAFLLAFGTTWTLAGVSTLFLTTDTAALVFLFQGAVGTPLAFALEKLLGYPPVSQDNSLTPLLILVATSQLPILLAAVVVYTLDPAGVPVAMAAIVGGHFLSYAWIHKSAIYVVMGVLVAVMPYALYVLLDDASFYLVGFFVGVALLGSSFVLRRNAERELSSSQEL